MNPVSRLFSQPYHIGIIESFDKLLVLALRVQFPQTLPDLSYRSALMGLFVKLASKLERGPAQMGLEDLANVHPRRDTKRVQDDIDWRPVGKPWHVFHRQDPRQHTFIPVAPGHFVTDLQTPLKCDEYFDHLDHAGREFIAGFQALEFGFVMLLH